MDEINRLRKFRICNIGCLMAVILLVSALIITPVYANPPPKVFTPVSRPHTPKELAFDYSVIYVVLWLGFLVAQPSNLHKMSLEKFQKNNFEIGAMFWDGNRFTTNFIGHPYAGSEYYLYFRSRGYAPQWAALHSMLSSALFEFGVESFNKPASGTDLVVTPALGVPLGWLREKQGLKMVASHNKYKRFVGHVLYPETCVFWFEDFSLNPAIDLQSGFTGLSFYARF